MLPQLKSRAQGRWLGILPALGIPLSYLTAKHGPCPLCGEGKDRWRWDNKDGRGTWICSHCGAGDGVSLVMKKNSWSFQEAAERIEQLIGTAAFEPMNATPTDQKKREAMNVLWRSGGRITGGSPAGKYLSHRCGITLFPSCLRAANNVKYYETSRQNCLS